MYPIEKYKFYQTKTADGFQKIIAVATYAGKTVRGVAICDPKDTFDPDFGKKLAAARCEAKVALKRLNRATVKYNEAQDAVEQTVVHCEKMDRYYDDAEVAYDEAEARLRVLLEQAE